MKKNHIRLSFLICLALCVACVQEKHDETQIKSYHVVLDGEPKSLDPAFGGELYGDSVIMEIMQPLYQYAYLQRPPTLEPCTALSMPKLSKDGLLVDIELKPNIFFQDDKAFPEGKGRELVAEDYVYSINRLLDAKLNSTGKWLFEGHLKNISAPSKYALHLELNHPYPQLFFALAMPFSVAVAHEVVERYGNQLISHPVGTGPFMLKEWRRNLDLQLKRNPNYRIENYPTQGEAGDVGLGLLGAASRPVPFLDEITFHVIQEDQTRWLNFMRGNLDNGGIPKDNYSQAVNERGELKQELKSRGIRLWKEAALDITFEAFNMEDPLLGKNLELRKALSLAFDGDKRIKLMYNNRAIAAQGPIPPGLPGYDAAFKNPFREFNRESAKEHLVKAGYPEGKGLPTLVLESSNSTTARQMDELLKSDFAAIGIKLQVNNNPWPQLVEKINKKQAQIFGLGWSADYPDAENFLSLFYGPNASPGNNQSNYLNPNFDTLFDKARRMTDGPERSTLYQQLAQMVVADVPMIFGVHRLDYRLQQPWLKNFKPHPLKLGMIKYYDVDPLMRSQMKKSY